MHTVARRLAPAVAALLAVASAPLAAQHRTADAPLPSVAAPRFGPVTTVGGSVVDLPNARMADAALAPAPAQSAGVGRGGRSFGGAVLGGAAGILVGSIAFASVFGECTDPGNPDTCLGQLQYAVVGAYVGNTLGAPLGAHYANRRRGNLGRSLAVSTGMAAAGAVALWGADRHAGERSRGRLQLLAPLVIFGVPIAQVITSATIEADTSRERAEP
jgi:hypothetical protein